MSGMTKETVNAQLMAFLGESTTPFHAVTSMVSRLQSAGFTLWSDASREPLLLGGKHFTVRNDSSLVAFTVGQSLENGLRLVGAHTDSPNLSVKPNPAISRFGCNLLAVDVYGGALLNPWFDRDLSMAGKVSVETDAGELVSCLIDFKRAIAVIPSLAIHLDGRRIKGEVSIPKPICCP